MIERRTCDCATTADQVAELRERVRALEALLAYRSEARFGMPEFRWLLASEVLRLAQSPITRRQLDILADLLRRYDDLVAWRT